MKSAFAVYFAAVLPDIPGNFLSDNQKSLKHYELPGITHSDHFRELISTTVNMLHDHLLPHPIIEFIDPSAKMHFQIQHLIPLLHILVSQIYCLIVDLTCPDALLNETSHAM